MLNLAKKTLSIAGSTVPSQEHTRQSFPARGQFAPDDWQFNVNRANAVDYQTNNAIQSDYNYFALSENYQNIKNGMFNPLTGEEPIYGHVNYSLNPLDQEQTNAGMSGYQNQKQTRVSDNMSPAYSMQFPAYKYPVNTPPNVWANIYMGSTRK
jgi:hypothetical protein